MEHFELITATGTWRAERMQKSWRVFFDHSEVKAIQKLPEWELYFLPTKCPLEIMGIILKMEAAI